jgi:hypothetical protein
MTRTSNGEAHGYDVTEHFWWSPALAFPVKHTVEHRAGTLTAKNVDWELVAVKQTD